MFAHEGGRQTHMAWGECGDGAVLSGELRHVDQWQPFGSNSPSRTYELFG